MLATCLTCVHFRGEAIGESARRECRATSPRFAVPRPGPDNSHLFVAQWPLVLPGDGCGDHRPAPVELMMPAAEPPAELPVDPFAEEATEVAETEADPAPEPTKPRKGNKG